MSDARSGMKFLTAAAILPAAAGRMSAAVLSGLATLARVSSLTRDMSVLSSEPIPVAAWHQSDCGRT